MRSFDRRYDSANEIKEASLFGNPAQHPGVAVAGQQICLKDRHRNGVLSRLLRLTFRSRCGP